MYILTVRYYSSRFVNDQELVESENVQFTYVKKDSMYSVTLTGNLKDKEGKVKVVGKNNGGEDSAECKLTIGGRAPTFVEKPLKCTILEGNMKLSVKLI